MSGKLNPLGGYEALDISCCLCSHLLPVCGNNCFRCSLCAPVYEVYSLEPGYRKLEMDVRGETLWNDSCCFPDRTRECRALRLSTTHSCLVCPCHVLHQLVIIYKVMLTCKFTTHSHSFVVFWCPLNVISFIGVAIQILNGTWATRGKGYHLYEACKGMWVYLQDRTILFDFL